jgi:hypothetical protein
MARLLESSWGRACTQACRNRRNCIKRLHTGGAKGIGLGFMVKLQPLQPRRQRQQNSHLDAMVRSNLGVI